MMPDSVIEPVERPSYVRLLGERLRQILWVESIKTVEFWLCIKALGWGGILLWPGDSFTHTPATHRAFLLIPHAEACFGASMFLIGLFQLWTVLGACMKVRARASILTALAWSVIAVIYAMGAPYNPTSVGHSITTVMALWICARLWMWESA